MAYAYKNKLETRALVGNALVILVGLGSVAFHATLLYDLQMWDEIPMVWLILSWYYGLWTLNSPPGRTNRWLVFILVFYGLLCTGVHYNGAYTVAFQLHFALITVVAGMILVFKWWNRGKDPRFGFMIPLLLLSISIAMTCWVIFEWNYQLPYFEIILFSSFSLLPRPTSPLIHTATRVQITYPTQDN
eukprot:TRINITY_DN4274_c0_g2_i5.p1 TRINITY_DN4274_c0_g2~~TRINITY_DN4274_c0_g2_i5.p1  ORF type:complete len:188 (-),score=11.92 TRINITY_DN4274_c0_g2_i5:462-1025(-)